MSMTEVGIGQKVLRKAEAPAIATLKREFANAGAADPVHFRAVNQRLCAAFVNYAEIPPRSAHLDTMRNRAAVDDINAAGFGPLWNELMGIIKGDPPEDTRQLAGNLISELEEVVPDLILGLMHRAAASPGRLIP